MVSAPVSLVFFGGIKIKIPLCAQWSQILWYCYGRREFHHECLLVQAGLRPFDQSVDYHWGPITLLSTLDQEHTIEWSVVRIERLFFDSGLAHFIGWAFAYAFLWIHGLLLGILGCSLVTCLFLWFQRCLATLSFIGDLRFFGFKNYHWLWLVIFGWSLVTCLFLWFQLGLAAAFKERECVWLKKGCCYFQRER